MSEHEETVHEVIGQEEKARKISVDAAKHQAAEALSSLQAIRPTRSHLAADVMAGLTFAAVNIPQGLAYALMAGVNPVFGLYTLMIATPVGAILTGAVYMNVSSTSALAASTGDVMLGYASADRGAALVTLVLLIGTIQFIMGILRLGFVMQFVPNSVMVGFTHGVAVLIILGQLGDLTGYYSSQSNRIMQLADLLLHHSSILWQTLTVGITTIALILLFDRSKNLTVRRSGLFIAMIMASAIPWLLGWDSVAIVRDVATVPQSLPKLVLPDLSLILDMLLPAAALAILGLVQGASVSQLYPNPDGKFSNASRDFLGQGAANLLGSLFQGIPAGGSTSGTAVIVGAGAQTRWANVFAGLWVIIMVLLLGGIVEMVAMPALAGLLIVVGFRMINLPAVVAVWQTGRIPRVSAVLTFAAALVAPLQIAILVGVLVAVLLHIFQQSQKVSVVEMVWSDTLFPEERPVRTRLTSNSITVLQLYGSVFFAAAGTFEKLLPEVDGAKRAVVLLLLRGHDEVGSTFINALTRYARQLQTSDGRLMLVGISEVILTQLDKSGALQTIGRENTFVAEAQWGHAAQRAYTAAYTWLGNDAKLAPVWSLGTEPMLAASYAASPAPNVSASPTAPTIYQGEAEARLIYLDELERLADLEQKGILTAEEFSEKKRSILGLDK